MNEINLLPKGNSTTVQQERAAALFRRIATVTLAGTAFLSIVIFILVLQSPLSQAEKKEQQLVTEINTYATQISRNSIIQERVKTIDQVIQSRNAYEVQIAALMEAIPEDVVLSSVDIVKGKIAINGNTTSLEKANSIFDKIKEMKDKKEIVASAVLKSYSLQNSNGRYVFTIDIQTL